MINNSYDGEEMNIKQQVIKSIKQCMMKHKSLTNDYVKILRINKHIKPMKINKMKKNRISIQFQDDKKTYLVIPRRSNHYHTQIHLDKHYRLVKYIRVKIKKDSFRDVS